jgi:superfamily II DNA helicase RecQ
MKQQLFIIAHTWQDTDLTIHTFFTAHKAVKKLGELVDDGFEKPNPDDDPLEYLERYRTWYQDERDNECDNVIAMEVVDIPETAPAPVKEKPISEEDLNDTEKTIYAAFRLYRKDRAIEINLPEFMILRNETLMLIAKARPDDLIALSQIKGIGEDKIRRYGDDLIAILHAF